MKPKLILPKPVGVRGRIWRRVALGAAIAGLAAGLATGALPRAVRSLLPERGSVERRLSPAELREMQAHARTNPAQVFRAPEERMNVSGNCAGWATRVAATTFGVNYNRADAWNLAAANRSVERRYEVRSGEVVRTGFMRQEILDRIQRGVISPGTAIGTYYSASHYNKPGRPYTHIVLYQGEANGTHYFGQNFRGPETWSLEQLLANRKFMPLEIIAPR